jgi:DNA-binding HxlR family transcriptional regulator
MVAKSSAAKTGKPESKDDSGRNLQDVRAAKPRAGAPEALDRLIHERLRLGIVSALAANESLTFNELKNLMHITDGNLSVHARKLEEAGYITCNKYFEGRMPKTEYKLTSSGRRALENYLSHMESLIKQMRGR